MRAGIGSAPPPGVVVAVAGLEAPLDVELVGKFRGGPGFRAAYRWHGPGNRQDRPHDPGLNTMSARVRTMVSISQAEAIFAFGSSITACSSADGALPLSTAADRRRPTHGSEKASSGHHGSDEQDVGRDQPRCSEVHPPGPGGQLMRIEAYDPSLLRGA